MSKVSCLCDKVCIELASRPECGVECCCCDCRRATQWTTRVAADKQEPATVLLQYVDNDIVNITGEEHLGLLRLRNSSATTRVVAKCCSSVLLNVHYAYLKRRIMVMPGTCRLTYQGDPVLPYCRLHTKYLDQKRLCEMKPLESGGSNYACDDPLWLWSTGILQNVVFTSIPDKVQGERVQQLIQRIQTKKDDSFTIVLDFPEPNLPGHFRTGGGMLSLTLKNPFYSAHARRQQQDEPETQLEENAVNLKHNQRKDSNK